MARFSTSLILLGLLGNLVTAYDQEEQNRNANCDKYRERYFCCMAEKCAASVLPDSIQRQTSECEARNMEFTFDVEKVCGITLTTTASSGSKTATSTATSGSDKSPATPVSTSTPSTADKTTKTSSTGASAASSTASSTTAANNAPQTKAMFSGLGILAVACGMPFL